MVGFRGIPLIGKYLAEDVFRVYDVQENENEDAMITEQFR